MKKKLTLTIIRPGEKDDPRKEYRKMSPEERLDLVEILRLEAGKFLYEYPARLRRVVEITRKA
jgi:hypothetical protein